MDLPQAEAIADAAVEQLRPHCGRVEIAGSIRRRRPEVGDIEIVASPKPYGTGLFESGIATVVNQWSKIKGELPCKYTQRALPEGIKLDLFFADETTWGVVYAIRTGSASFSHHVLATGWVKQGYKSVDARLIGPDGVVVSTPEEEDVFRYAGVRWIEPEKRELAK